MLIGKLQAKSAELNAEIAALVPISKAAEKAKVPAITVVHMILGGFLERVFRLKGQDGISALRVDPAEVKQHAAACMAGLQPAAGFGALKIPRDAGWRLVDRCPNEVSLAVQWVVGPDVSYRIPRFEPAVIAEFKARFSHPARIAKLYNLQIGEVVRRLKRRNIWPVLAKSEIGLDFYRNDDLKPELFN